MTNTRFWTGLAVAAALAPADAEAMIAALEAGLTGYTYLHEENASGAQA